MRELPNRALKLILYVITLGVALSCASNNVLPTATHSENKNKFNPGAPADDNALQITLDLQIGDGDGTRVLVQPVVEIHLANSVGLSGRTWQDLIGSQLVVKIANYGFPIEIGDSLQDNYLLTSVPPLSLSDFKNLHDSNIQLTDFDGNLLAEGSVKTPPAFSDPSKNYPLLSQREFSHCRVDPSLYDETVIDPATLDLKWNGTSSNPVKITLNDGAETFETYEVDRGSWLPEISEIEKFIHPLDKNFVDKEGGVAESIVNVSFLRAHLEGLLMVSNNRGDRELPVEIRVTQSLRFYLTYYGDQEGC